MPVTKQAEKKLRHDKVRSIHNAKKQELVRDGIKQFRKKPSQKSLPKVFQLLDKAVKTHLIHKNRGDRLKSRLSKMVKSNK
ncbi:MAG: 30S ribosomal protein S20 [Microgenomates group bacterium GW2011_GWC1_43_11]|uniref:Small ribosomal subunit protein bS20 n=1 Tax=Candidatus Gottesmanbacteria bacterium GW2011_GWA1_44_24b TaxID=1618437 RepID=A0A0G1IN14_9BACT|nr:MAG: 30S ribosomal protein S20 [Microgenomates group bacterium GW2011_GWC1_43_11]KKT60801.1 MAG: 30S ribosomal protein S20 [Candidatus Gottesmanbacteria bacterium GW2011_GWA1_44_24b]HCM82275.1 30S ribosomal protein S20 [Patescibacteria group bacterium]